jgi:hypothetical protein
MKGCTQTESQKELGLTLGRMGQSTKESSKMDCDSVRVSGSMALRSTKDLISMIKGMEKELITGLAEAITKEISFKTSGTDMDKCIGITHFIKGSGSKEYNKEKVKFGRIVNLLKKDFSKMES